MRRLSSALTYFYKRVFPLLWFGILAAVMLPLVLVAHAGHRQLLPFLLPPALIAVFGFVLYRKLVADLVDEVWLVGDDLLVKNRGEQAAISLREVMNVNAMTMMNPRRITLMLRGESRFGRQVVFMPAVQAGSLMSGFKPDPIATELIGRVEALRTPAP